MKLPAAILSGHPLFHYYVTMMPTILGCFVLLLLVFEIKGFAFPLRKAAVRPKRPSAITVTTRYASYSSEESGEAASDGPWRLDNDFQFFLNQISIQSLLFLMVSLRDRNTAIWLEEFTQPVIRERTKEKVGRDVVLGSMAKAYQEATEDIPAAEKEIMLLTYHGLAVIDKQIFPTWENYFLQLLEMPAEAMTVECNRPNVPSYELEINPASLCSRLISVREQIAREFVRDLDSLADISARFINDFYEYKKNSNGEQQQEEGYRTNLMFLDEIIGEEDYRPSPLRKGNFDLLSLLVTQESINRILNDDSVDRSSSRFLRSFYVQRIGSHFTGNNFYGRADNFLEELLTTSPSVSQMQDEEFDLVDPLRVAGLILKEREKVADEWIDLALNAPNSHTDIKREQLQKLMGNYQ